MLSTVKGANPGLLEACYAKSSWAKHCAAYNCFKKFEKLTGQCASWPLNVDVICEFVSWALLEYKLKPDTVKSYLHSIKIIHLLNNMEYLGNNFVVNSLLRGAENLSFYESVKGSNRKVMTLPLLKIIGHQIAISDWCTSSKLVVWTACVVAFFGSFRFGEILPNYSHDFCAEETLLWSDVKFRNDKSILVHVKIDKCLNKHGSYVDIFEFKNNKCCPVDCLVSLKKIAFNPSKPVFQFPNGKNLCAQELNQILTKLLTPIIGNAANDISGHSFRAGIPSAMANCPEILNKYDIQSWGRWSSDSYLSYTRLKLGQKKQIFEKIVRVLDK